MGSKNSLSFIFLYRKVKKLEDYFCDKYVVVDCLGFIEKSLIL